LRGFFVTLLKKFVMNKTIKTILLFLGVLLLGYGICILNPAKDNNNNNTTSYIIIASGILSLVLSLLKEKKK
jgi:uncharacterized membrane protein HdeD (DUF308 family)